MRYGMLLGLCLLLLPGRGHGQTRPVADTAGIRLYTYTETMPVFPALTPADSARSTFQRVRNFLEDSLRTMPLLLNSGITGKVYFAFAVDAQGHATDIRLVKGLRPDLDAAVLHNAQRLKQVQWQPGTQNSRPVRVSFTVPISFRAGGSGLAGSGPFRSDSLDGPAPRPFIQWPLPDWAPGQRRLPAGQGLVYGSCTQRLGFGSGGFGQYVRLENLSTGQGVNLGVKPLMRTRAENPFCYALPPGRYALHYYFFTASKWYGGEMHTEPLRKAALTGPGVSATRYVFTVVPGRVQYVGNWDFRLENRPTFRNEKAELDAQLAPRFKYLDFDQAAVALPE